MRRFIKRLQSTAVAGSLLALAAPSLATNNPPRSLHLDGYQTKDAVSFIRLAAETDYFDVQASSEIPRQNESRGDDLSKKQVNSAVARIGPKYGEFNGRLLLGVEGEDRLLGAAWSAVKQSPSLLHQNSIEHVTAEGFVRLRERKDIRRTGETVWSDVYWNTGWAITPNSEDLNIAAGMMVSNSFDRQGFIGGYFGASTDNIGWSASFERDNQDLFYNLAVGRTLNSNRNHNELTKNVEKTPSLQDLVSGRIKWEPGIQQFSFKYTIAQNSALNFDDRTPYNNVVGPNGPRTLARNEVIARQLRQQEDFGYLQDIVVDHSGIAASLEFSREENSHARLIPSLAVGKYGFGVSAGVSVPVSKEENIEYIGSASLNDRHEPYGFGGRIVYDPKTSNYKGEGFVRIDSIF